MKAEDLDDIARRRVLMVLSVLSGEQPVTEVIGLNGLSRVTYYKLEEKALRAMMAALSPGAGAEGTEASALEAERARAKGLEESVKRLEREKRRAQRLLYLTRKVLKPGPVVGLDGRGRKRGPRRASTRSGSEPSRSSATLTAATSPETTAREAPNGAAASGE